MLNKYWYIILAVVIVFQSNLSAGLQDDINAIAGTGGTVIIPAGTTTIYSTISVPSNVTIKGVSVNSVLKAANGLNGPVLSNSDQINGNTGIRLKGFAIDGNKSNQSSGEGILLVNTSDIIMEDVRIHNCYFSGIRVNGNSDTISFEGCIVYSNGFSIGNGIVIEGNPSNISVANCTIHDNKINGISASGINIRMIGNSIYQHTGGRGVLFSDSNDALVICNRVQGAADSGIAMNDSANFVTLGNNVSDANMGIGISASLDFIVNGNLASGNRDGINMNAGDAGGEGALVSNNLLSESLRRGVYSYNYGNSIVAANVAINSGTVNEDGYGIHITGKSGQSPAHLVINANEGVDTRMPPGNFQKYGLRLEYLNEPLVSDNVLLNANTYDMSIGAGVTDLSENNNLVGSSQMSSPGNCSDVVAGGYRLIGDLDSNCQIDLRDIAILAADWLQCNDPQDVSCSANWPTY
ncbi:MAG: right-handed parallel beta-helix repeat-containing protein [Sedimentisphaerales bacterium]